MTHSKEPVPIRGGACASSRQTSPTTVVRRAGANLRQRALPAASVASWHAKIERLDPDGPVCRLDAWIRLVADTKSAVASLADA